MQEKSEGDWFFIPSAASGAGFGGRSAPGKPLRATRWPVMWVADLAMEPHVSGTSRRLAPGAFQAHLFAQLHSQKDDQFLKFEPEAFSVSSAFEELPFRAKIRHPHLPKVVLRTLPRTAWFCSP